MRHATDIQLKQLIIHILDPWGTNKLVLSKTTCPLEDNTDLVEYFKSHIESSLRDKATKAAKFKEFENETTGGVCKSILDRSTELIKGSSELANKLYGIMARNKAISACDLAICLYKTGDRPKIPYYLALLKLDPSKALRHVTKKDAQGKLFVNFEFLKEDVLPTTRERLQKCAFIQPLDQSPDYDMMLLDRQVGRPEERAVAKFFAEDFLNCDIALDSRQLTHRFYVAMISAHNTIRPNLTPKQGGNFRQKIDNAVRNNSVDIDDFIKNLGLEGTHEDTIHKIVSERLPVRSFVIDKDYAKRLLKIRHFNGDFGLKVYVRAANFKQVIREVIPPTDGKGYFKVVIHTKNWKEVL